MARNDQDYYRERARKEREMARQATDFSVACAHRQLAEEYERRSTGQSHGLYLAQDA